MRILIVGCHPDILAKLYGFLEPKCLQPDAARNGCGGLAPGRMQQMRGAHFVSHTLWSAWIACAIVLALAPVLLLQGGALSGGTVRRAPAGTRSRAP